MINVTVSSMQNLRKKAKLNDREVRQGSESKCDTHTQSSHTKGLVDSFDTSHVHYKTDDINRLRFSQTLCRNYWTFCVKEIKVIKDVTKESN